MADYRDYQPKTTSRVLEHIEWSTTYTYGAPITTLPNVMLIGDSICGGYNGHVANRLDGKAIVSFWASSKCVTDKNYFRELDFMLDMYDYKFISFNNGLHSLTTDLEEWEYAYRQVIKFILAKKPDAKLTITVCTALNNEKLNERVRIQNAIIMKIAEDFGLPTVDLFTPTDALDKDKEMSDEFHFHANAIGMQADILAKHITERLEL